MKTPRWWLSSLLLPLLTACGGQQEPPAAAATVWVEVVGQDSGEQGFAGEVRARRESALSFQVAGRLLRRHVDDGERVRAGQLLAELDVADYALAVQAAQADLAAAQAAAQRSAGDLARYQALAADQLVSRSTLDAQHAADSAAQAQARAARANLEVARNQAGYARLLAPVDGVVAGRQVEAGQVVAAGQTVMTLAADDGRDVLIALPESAIASFRLGQRARVELWNAPQRHLEGELREIAAAADVQARTFAARVALDSAAAASVVLGQSARVYITRPHAQLSVPLGAVQRAEDGRAHVWRVDPASSTLKAQPVTVARWGQQRAQIASGLEPGQWVVAAGGHLLADGQSVRAIDRDNRPLAAPAGAAGTGE